MKFSGKAGSIAITAGIFLILSAVWFLLWTWSSASLRCVPCDCRYGLNAANSYCRLPAILVLLFFVSLVGGIGSFIVARFQRRRVKRIIGALEYLADGNKNLPQLQTISAITGNAPETS